MQNKRNQNQTHRQNKPAPDKSARRPINHSAEMPHQRATSSWPAVCEGFIGTPNCPVNAVFHKTEKNAICPLQWTFKKKIPEVFAIWSCFSVSKGADFGDLPHSGHVDGSFSTASYRSHRTAGLDHSEDAFSSKAEATSCSQSCLATCRSGLQGVSD
jgi:hypothetical protein